MAIRQVRCARLRFHRETPSHGRTSRRRGADSRSSCGGTTRTVISDTVRQCRMVSLTYGKV